jgi:hypothetical protein
MWRIIGVWEMVELEVVEGSAACWRRVCRDRSRWRSTGHERLRFLSVLADFGFIPQD